MTKVQADSIYYTVKKRVLSFVLLGIIFYSVIASVLFIFFAGNYKLGIVTFAMGLMAVSMMILCNNQKYFKQINLILVILLNLLFCPLLLVYGGIN